MMVWKTYRMKENFKHYKSVYCFFIGIYSYKKDNVKQQIKKAKKLQNLYPFEMHLISMYLIIFYNSGSENNRFIYRMIELEKLYQNIYLLQKEATSTMIKNLKD